MRRERNKQQKYTPQIEQHEEEGIDLGEQIVDSGEEGLLRGKEREEEKSH